MNVKPILQTKLYGLKINFEEIVNLFNSFAAHRQTLDQPTE